MSKVYRIEIDPKVRGTVSMVELKRGKTVITAPGTYAKALIDDLLGPGWDKGLENFKDYKVEIVRGGIRIKGEL